MVDRSPDSTAADPATSDTKGGALGSDARWATTSFAVAGACSYVVLVLAGRALSADGFAVFAGFWSTAFFVAGATQAPLEQELARSRREGLADAADSSGTARSIIRISGGLVFAAGAAVVLAWSPFTSDMFDGSVLVLVATCSVFAGEACTAMVRGHSAGQGDFRRFAFVVGGQGVVRAGLIIGLAIAGVDDVGWYAVAVALGNVPGVAASGPLRHTAMSGRGRVVDPALRRHLKYLYLAGPFIALFTIGVPAVAKALASEADTADVGRLLAALSLTSAPIFLFTALQSSILPHFTELATSGDLPAFRRVLRRLGTFVAGAGLIGTLAALVVGRRLLALLFGPDKQVPQWQMAALAVTTAAMMMAIATAPALLALKRHGSVAAGWAAGAAVFAVGLAWSDDLLTRCIGAMAAGTITAATVITVVTVTASSRRTAIVGGSHRAE